MKRFRREPLAAALAIVWVLAGVPFAAPCAASGGGSVAVRDAGAPAHPCACPGGTMQCCPVSPASRQAVAERLESPPCGCAAQPAGRSAATLPVIQAAEKQSQVQEAQAASTIGPAADGISLFASLEKASQRGYLRPVAPATGPRSPPLA